MSYGLRHKETGKILRYQQEDNGPNADGIRFSYGLNLEANDMWLVDNPRLAEYVRLNSTPWYNADYKTPMHYFDSEELEVVYVNVVVKVRPVNVKIPTVMEFYKKKFKNSPQDFEDIRKHIEDGRVSYSWYDLQTQEEKKNAKRS